MSDVLTRISLPGCRGGSIMDWGQKSADDMVDQIRKWAQYNLEIAQAVLDAAPDQFQIDVVRGSIVQRHLKTVQQSARSPHV